MSQLVTQPMDAFERLIPRGHASPEQQRRYDDLRTQTKQFYLTILSTVPENQHRINALDMLRKVVTAAVLGIAVPR